MRKPGSKRNFVTVRVGFGVVLVCLLSVAGCKKAGEESTGEADQQPGNVAEQGPTDSFGDWASNTWNGAVSGGTQTVQNTGQWINEMYQSAKDQGITSANSVKEWVADDWNAQGDWQYRLISVDASDAKAVEAKLNEVGSDRWECYHVDTSGSQWTFFMKRSRRSYLSRVPLKDLANMLPGTSGESGE